MVQNNVMVNMDDKDYWYSMIEKEKFVVILLCDLSSNTCYTFGGSDLTICKNIKKLEIKMIYMMFL